MDAYLKRKFRKSRKFVIETQKNTTSNHWRISKIHRKTKSFGDISVVRNKEVFEIEKVVSDFDGLEKVVFFVFNLIKPSKLFFGT